MIVIGTGCCDVDVRITAGLVGSKISAKIVDTVLEGVFDSTV